MYFFVRLYNKHRLCHNINLLHFTRTLITTKINGMGDINEGTFKGRLDQFKGVTVISDLEKCEPFDFPAKLSDSLKLWRKNEQRGIWFKVHLDQADWVPFLAKEGFKFHHAKNEFVMMYLWLPSAENSNIPQYAHTMVGVGAVVVNNKSQILVVKENSISRPHWKLPGGYAENGENLVDAAIREVWEETNIQTEFQSLLTLRHSHHGAFGCSDIYIIVSLKPLTQNIEKCEREIADSKWMDINEYISHPDIHDLNKLFLQKYVEYNKRNIKIDCHHGIHQVLNKAYTVYYVDYKENDEIPKK